MGDHSILGFAIDSSGQVSATPTRVIRGPSTGLHNPFDVATDSAERIYVANLGDPPGSGSSVTVYSSNANGDAQPIRILGTHPDPRPQFVQGHQFTIRPRPEGLLVADQTEPPSPRGGRIMEFSAAVGQDDPIAVIGDLSSPLGSPAGIGLDQAQRIHVLDTVTPRIIIYPSAPVTGPR